MVKEWFQKHIELFVKYKISKDVFDEAATNLRVMEFRPYAKEFIEFLHQNNIPLIIISAGIGNFIESFLKHNNCNFDNVYISSNKILFNIQKENESEKIKNRNNILLLGDQVSDLNMINKKKHPSVISVGFLTPDSPKEDIISNFDIVCEENDNYNDIKNLLFNFK